MNLITKYMTKNPCYTTGRTITVKGLMLHSVGCPQPDPLVFIRNWDKPSFDTACVHGFIGEHDAYITLPCMETAGKAMRGWHGGGASNNTHIGVEMCEPSCIKYTGGANFTCSNRPAAVAYVEAVTRNAVELFAQLCALHGLNPLTDIISHAEGHALGIASNHGDPDHLWRQLGMNYSMDTFRRDVLAEMQKEDENMPRFNTMEEIEQGASYAVPTVQKLIASGAIRGGGKKDAEGNPADMDLSKDMLRVLVMSDRAGAFGD